MVRRINVLAAALVVLLGAALLLETGGLMYVFGSPPSPDDYETARVTVRDENGTALATVDARIADTDRKQYVGLSRTDALTENEGMLFVRGTEGEHTFVMRNMSFPLDIIFVAADGTITTIHHAPVEPNASESDLTRYEGQGKYVLEVRRGYTNRTGIEEGDVVEIPKSVD